jgi:GH25 family lysozyme M1 (1,4-beta-N-acetylmuramidase)
MYGCEISRLRPTPAWPAQWAQQKNRPSASTPCPITRPPQYSHVGARACMAHSKLSNVRAPSPGGVTWNALRFRTLTTNPPTLTARGG